MNTKFEEEFNMTLGKRLSTIRSIHKISQERLGALIGVSHQQIYKYEAGESTMRAESIQKCSKIFNVPIGYFYGENETDVSRPRFDKSILTIAAEVQELPEDIRKGVYLLSRQINKTFSGNRKQEKEEQVA